MSRGLFLAFGVVFLAPYCVARTHASRRSKLDVYDRRTSMYDYTRLQARDLAKKTIHNGKNWLEDVHEEIDNMTRRNEKTQELDQQIVDFLARARALSSIQDEREKRDKMIKIFMEVVRLYFKYDVSDVISPDPEIKDLAVLLTRNGMDVFADQFVVDFEECAKKVFAAMEQYVESLSSTEEQMEMNSDLIRQMNFYKAAHDFKQKFDIFSSM